MRVQATKLTFSPSDLNNFLECGHLVALEFAVAHGELARPAVDNPQAELIRRKGDEHERAYLESLRAKGLRSLAASLARQLPLERVSSPLLVRACAELEREPDFAQDVCASLLANYLVHVELGSKGHVVRDQEISYEIR